ncbi:hypothetical protein ACMYR3_09840 [Ampullimonas aquatilis]|uniref:hypothetical protein n=1 Tax=Ampullimonas aquatilis TaxID=1341549 RepID=UPI003C75B004
MSKSIAVIFSATLALAGCATGSGGFDSVNYSNAAQVHIFTPEEQAQMTPEGTIETMITPSEIRERFKNAGKVTKPTGVVNYCGAGLAQLVQSRREAALAAIDGACGGKDQYSVRNEGPGNMIASHAGDVKIGSSCTRSMAIIFRCNGAQPSPDIKKK